MTVQQCQMLICSIVRFAVLAKAINSFGRIGSELFMEATTTGLTLQTINLTKTSFASISFNSDFFLTFSAKSSSDPNENQCKVALKACLGVFRNMRQVGCQLIYVQPSTCSIGFHAVGGVVQDHVGRKGM